MSQSPQSTAFSAAALPHLDAAYNLARWLSGRDADALDIVQEAYLRALAAFGQYRGGDMRCWLLTIVRNTANTWLSRNRPDSKTVSYDEHAHAVASDASDPLKILEQDSDNQRVRQAVEQLPVEYREVLILREFEGLSYQEISAIADLPLGTVMSRLARARGRLLQTLKNEPTREK